MIFNSSLTIRQTFTELVPNLTVIKRTTNFEFCHFVHIFSNFSNEFQGNVKIINRVYFICVIRDSNICESHKKRNL